MAEKHKPFTHAQSYLLPAALAGLFYLIALWRYMATGKLFYLYNFGYLGTALGLGILLHTKLPKAHIQWGRRITQLLIGSYMLLFLGLMQKENMQLEGFFFYLSMGIFAGATLHYLIAKIIGPLFFHRGWCGWACWTAMFLDFLPWKKPASSPIPRLGLLRYLHFCISATLVALVWFTPASYSAGLGQEGEMHWFAAGNILYYFLGTILAITMKDNRAFCKYLCPIPVLQKPGARFSLLKVQIQPEKCINCGLCEKNCPMDIPLLQYKEKGVRVLSTECILCLSCKNVCPVEAITITLKIDRRK